MSNIHPDKQFTHDRVRHADGSISFRCSTDQDAWPWLALHPHHPIAVQNLQFWASVECGMESGAFDGTKWTALTWTRWSCGMADVGGFARGVSDTVTEDGKLMSRLTLFDAHDREICSMLSKGVEFRTRDFEAWRAKAKQSGVDALDISKFAFAAPEAVGSAGIGPALIAPLHSGKTPATTGLMTMDNAFPPAHPYMSGSGDHVNATHLAEAAHQFLHLTQPERPLRITGGEMRFTSYVELGQPFQVEQVDTGSGSVTATVRQGGRDCTQITLTFANN